MENFISTYSPSISEQRAFLSRTYLWMGLALLVSALVSYAGAASGFIITFTMRTRGLGIIGLCVAELILVIYFSATIRRISVTTAKVLFIIYAAVNGLTLSTIFLVYTKTSIGICFVTAAAMFFAMALYGAKTRSNLSSIGRYLVMGLIGVFIASLLNGVLYLFGAGSSILSWIISLATVIIFTALTAYDSQKILRASMRADSSEAYKKIAIYGALELYLDFINIFLSLLRLFGNSRD